MTSASSPLTPEQVARYLDRIGLPAHARTWLREGPGGAHALEALTLLQQRHMAAVPFENLGLHYAAEPGLAQEADAVFDAVVARRRGGVCPQVHPLFARLLRSLGFAAYCTGARLNAPASVAADPAMDKSKVAYGPWIHVVVLVHLPAQPQAGLPAAWYLIDTSTGPFGATYPQPLVHDRPDACRDMAPRQRRMLYGPVPGLSVAAAAADGTSSSSSSSSGAGGPGWWRMQLREGGAEPWMDVCCFVPAEWTPADFQIMVAGLASLGAGWFTSRVVCFRVLLDDDDDDNGDKDGDGHGAPVGYLIAWQDELRRWYKGTVEVLQRFYCEADRVAALEEEFGIVLTEEEQAAIVGRPTELADVTGEY
ncbi:hypothetical protein VTH06DRAFT_258 [Thermothelomyces fergusii]